MGNGSALGTAKERAINKAITDDLRFHYLQLRRTIKLLLLGAAECGKSTVLKQLKILNNRVFSDDEIEAQRPVIYSNIITFIVCIVDAMAKLGISFNAPERHEDIRLLKMILHAHREYEQPGPLTVEAVNRLWKDDDVQACYARRDEYQLSDSAKYFLDSVDRIADSSYRPTEQDILRARAATVGIVEVIFEMNQVIYKNQPKLTTGMLKWGDACSEGSKWRFRKRMRVVDVGGQRSARKKWIHCFDSVNAIIFVVSLAEYNLRLREDGETNRMAESIDLFDSVSNSNFFLKTSIVLFLNKKDLFAEKIEKIPLTVAFPKYKGPQTYYACADFIEDQFIARNRNGKRPIYPHQTCGTDTTQVQFVLQSVLDTICAENMKSAGLSS